MAVNGDKITGRKDEYRRLATTSPIVAVSCGSPTSAQYSLAGFVNTGLSREFASSRASSSSPTSSSHSSEDAMNMRFTELTHMHLKKSLHQIQGQHQLLDSDIGDRHSSRQASSSAFVTVPSIGSISSRSNQTNIAGNIESSKYQSLLSVKDALLEEKESAIVKLRLEVSSLQHQVKETNATLRQVLRNKDAISSTNSNLLDYASVDSAIVNLDGMETRARLAESIADREKNFNELQRVLGKTECRLANAENQLAREKGVLEAKMKELEACLREKDKSIADGKQKHKSLIDRIEKYKRRVESLERYLGDLPTMEESRAMKKTVDNLLIDRESLAVDLERITKKYVEIAPVLEEKENFLRTESENNAYLKREIETLSSKIADLEKSREELQPAERKDLENKSRQLEKIERERDEAVKLLTAADKRIAALTTEHLEEISKLEERIDQEENVSESLKRDLGVKQQASTKLQSAMTKLASQNQQLMEEKMSFLEQLRTLEHERSSTRDTSRVIARLYHETQIAVRDLEAVSQVLLQTAKGDDPNLSALLGVRTSSVGIDDVDEDVPVPSVEAASKKLTDLRRLRCDIDELRSTLSNRYAENIGRNCATQ